MNSGPITAQGGGWGPAGPPQGPFGPPGGPPGYPQGSNPHGGGPPPGGYGGPGGGGQGSGYGPPRLEYKPITGGNQTLALHAMNIDPRTGLPIGERPPASTAAVVSLVCGVLLCLGPVTGFIAIVAGVMGKLAASRSPLTVGGGGMSVTGILLGLLNLLLSVGFALMFLAGAIGG